jgi:ABC-type molybdenum transport system ATPase subunit/photorepair protein PhrA
MNAEIDALLDALGPARWSGPEHSVQDNLEWDKKPFALLSPGEQGLVLLLRALAGKPPLLILDEVFAGMDSQMIAVAKDYLSSRLDPSQAVIFVTHWEEEVPWKGDTLQSIIIDNGNVSIIS